MRKITREYTLYDYSELCEQAKKNARRVVVDYCVADLQDNYEREIEYGLKHAFPNSSLNYEYSLSSCQGDGFNIYGELSLEDAFVHWDNPFTSREVSDLMEYATVFCGRAVVELPKNKTRYCYCYVDRLDLVEDWCEQLQMDECPYDEKLIATFNKWLIDKVESLCYLLERKGYHDLYEPGEKDIKEMCEIYGLEFLCDGTMY